MKSYLKVALLAIGILLVVGMAEAQNLGFGTKVKSGDPDVGLPLSPFGVVPFPPTPVPQFVAFLSWWDIGSTPNIMDDQDVQYLEFGKNVPGALRNVMAGDIRLTPWQNYPAGSQVKAGDRDIGQPLQPNPLPLYTSGALTGFRWMNIGGSAGYDLCDTVYLNVAATAVPSFVSTSTNDIRITPSAVLPDIFPAGSRVSMADPDAMKPLQAFKGAFGGAGIAPATVPAPIAQLAFYNANGNIMGPIPPLNGIYDYGDAVYLDVTPLGEVSPNDVRLTNNCPGCGNDFQGY